MFPFPFMNIVKHLACCLIKNVISKSNWFNISSGFFSVVWIFVEDWFYFSKVEVNSGIDNFRSLFIAKLILMYLYVLLYSHNIHAWHTTIYKRFYDWSIFTSNTPWNPKQYILKREPGNLYWFVYHKIKV